MNVVYETIKGMKIHYRIDSKTRTIYLINTKDPKIFREAKRTLEYCIK